MQHHKAREQLERHTKIIALIQGQRAVAPPQQHPLHPGIVIAYTAYYIVSAISRTRPITEGGNPMTCTKCNGLMIVDHFLDMKESYLPMWMQAFRCLACGNVADPLIHFHRTTQRAQRANRLTRHLVKKTARPAVAA